MKSANRLNYMWPFYHRGQIVYTNYFPVLHVNTRPISPYSQRPNSMFYFLTAQKVTCMRLFYFFFFRQILCSVSVFSHQWNGNKTVSEHISLKELHSYLYLWLIFLISLFNVFVFMGKCHFLCNSLIFPLLLSFFIFLYQREQYH